MRLRIAHRGPRTRGRAARALIRVAAAALTAAAASQASAQSPAPPVLGAHAVTVVTPKAGDLTAPGGRAGVRVRVRDAAGKPVARRRLYLLTRSASAAGLDWASLPAREEFLRAASPELREWLGRHDCDTIYCPEYEAEYAKAVETVPEFRRAYAEGLRKYRSPRTALRWVTVNFPLREARTAFYERKKSWLAAASARAGAVQSAMTDEAGDAYFLDVPVGDYFVSNLFPHGPSRILWDAPVKVPPLLPGKRHSASVVLDAMPRA